MKLAEKIYNLGKQQGMSQEELAERLAYSSLTDGVETALDEADRIALEDDRRYTHEEVFEKLRCCMH